MAVMWVNRDRRYFIKTARKTTPGVSIFRERYRTNNGRMEMVELAVNISKLC